MFIDSTKYEDDLPPYSRIIFGGGKSEQTMNKQESKTFAAGERVITKGDNATHAYLIVDGRVRVFLEKDHKHVTLSELSTGAIFGESAIFEGKEYSANVEALEDTKVMIITLESFRDKVEKCDPMLRSIIAMLMDRQDRTNQALLESETREFVEVEMI